MSTDKTFNTICWTCMATFNSNNKLFNHLREANHEIDPPKRCRACLSNDYVDIKNHCLICDSKQSFSFAYYYNKGYNDGIAYQLAQNELDRKIVIEQHERDIDSAIREANSIIWYL